MDFNSLIDDEVNSHKTALAKSALIAHNVDPDKHVANINKAKKQGMHPALATPAIHPANAAELDSLTNDFLGTSGHTAATLSDPEKAKKAKDSTGNMTEMESILKVIPRVLGHTVASFAQMPISGVSALAKLLHTGSLTEANKVLEENQKTLDNYYLTTDEERQDSANIGKLMIPFQMAGRGLAGLAELPTGGLQGAIDVVEGRSSGSNIGVPIAGTIGEAAAMFGFGEIGETRLAKMVSEHAAKIIDTAKQSPFRKRAPVDHAEFVDGVTKEDPHPPFQMPVDKATEMYARTDDKTPPSIVTAKFEGTKVDVPVADLIKHADNITLQDTKEMSVEGAPSVSELEKKAEAGNPATKQKQVVTQDSEVKPDMIRPAVKTEEGVKTGKDGERHTDIVKDAPEEDRGFTLDGKTMMSREEGAAWLKENKPGLYDKLPEDQKESLHSEGLWQSQGVEVPKDAKPFERLSPAGKRGTTSAYKVNLSPSQTDTLKAIRQEVSDGEAGQRVGIYNTHEPGFTQVSWGSSFPEYFKNKGLTKKEILPILDRIIKGESVTEKQWLAVEDMAKAKRHDTMNQVLSARAEKAAESESISHMTREELDAAGSAADDFFAQFGGENEPTTEVTGDLRPDATGETSGSVEASGSEAGAGTPRAESIDQSGWSQQVGIDGDKKQAAFGDKKQGGESVGLSEFMDGFTPDPQQDIFSQHTADPAQPIAGGFFGNERGAIDLTGAVETAQKISDYVTIDPVPRMKRANVSDSAVAHASARIAVPHIVDDLLSKVFPDSYKNSAKMAQTIDILNKDNILGGYDTFLDLAAKAYEEGKDDEASKFMSLADAVREKHDLVQYDQDIREASDNAEITGNVQRWKEHVSPELDKLYNEMKGVDPLTERSGRGRYLDARINLLSEDKAALWTEAMADGDKPMPEPSASGYRNPNAKADRYDKHASFTGDYSDDAKAVLANVIGPRWNEVTKLRMYNDLIDKGVAFKENPGEGYAYMPVKMPKTDKAGATHMADVPLFVRKDLVREIRDVLNTDVPLEPNAVMKVATGIQLAQIADAVTHTKNIMTVVTKAQGAGTLWKDITRKMPVFGTADAIGRIISVTKEVSGDSPAIRAEISDMAKQGLIRPTFPPSGLQKITRGQQFIHAADTGARVVMNRFFDNLLDRGLVEDSVANRRDFINQVGMYNKRLTGPLMKAAAQSGLSPFIVAGRNFNRQGRWAVTGNPGVKASSLNAAFQLRMTNLLGTAALFTIPMIMNTLTTGKPGGRPGTSLGAWDLGTDEKNGKHKVIDLLQITGLRRGLKSIGIDALAEGLRNGLTMEQITNNALQDAAQTVIHPWMGPAMGGISKTVTGRQLDIRGHMDAQKIPGAGPFAPRQLGENFRAALESQNPLVYSMVRPALKYTGIDQKPDPKGATSDFLKAHFGETGAVVGNVAATLAKSPQSAFGVKDVMKGKSAAEELITQFEKRGDAIEPTQETNYAAKKEAIDLLRAGSDWGDMPQELQDKFSRMSTKQRKAIEKQADQTPLQHKFIQLEATKAIQVWKLATDAEREDLQSQYNKKLKAHKKGLEGDELDDFNDKIDRAEERK